MARGLKEDMGPGTRQAQRGLVTGWTFGGQNVVQFPSDNIPTDCRVHFKHLEQERIIMVMENFTEEVRLHFSLGRCIELRMQKQV